MGLQKFIFEIFHQIKNKPVIPWHLKLGVLSVLIDKEIKEGNVDVMDKVNVPWAFEILLVNLLNFTIAAYNSSLLNSGP